MIGQTTEWEKAAGWDHEQERKWVWPWGDNMTTPDGKRPLNYCDARCKTVVRAGWGEDKKTLRLIMDAEVETSQGASPLTSTSEFRLSDGGMTLTVTEYRSSWASDEPVITLVYRKVL